ncbi:hypothetical protein Tco_0428777 [Tanacetum coccineum]
MAGAVNPAVPVAIPTQTHKQTPPAVMIQTKRALVGWLSGNQPGYFTAKQTPLSGFSVVDVPVGLFGGGLVGERRNKTEEEGKKKKKWKGERRGERRKKKMKKEEGKGTERKKREERRKEEKKEEVRNASGGCVGRRIGF